MSKSHWGAAIAATAAIAAVAGVILVQGDSTPSSDQQPAQTSSIAPEAHMNQATDPEDPYIEDSEGPGSPSEWLEDAREGRDPNEQPQQLDGGVSSEAGFDEDGAAILRSEVTPEK
ncbi:hypothetical protein HQP05_25175 [Rhodococcus fascians]|nr:hypothetical protein [Rhodococcus fascians]MBY4010106.1 hypothetical protein [Rhodococcus fascians]MBY4035435.1 hypothetical protein [Rhodococcus fascians]MBY4091327.1 hypothetical protein [Rhodococcus fascians]